VPYESEGAELADMLTDNHLADLAEIDVDRLIGVLKELQAAGHDVISCSCSKTSAIVLHQPVEFGARGLGPGNLVGRKNGILPAPLAAVPLEFLLLAVGALAPCAHSYLDSVPND